MFPFKGGISEKMPFSTNVKKFGHLRLKVNFFSFHENKTKFVYSEGSFIG